MRSHGVLGIFAAVLVCISGSVTAATLWTGPAVNFTKVAFANPTLPANQDFLTSNVALTRGDNQGLYNALQESGYVVGSPIDTQWAFQGLNGNPGSGVTASNYLSLVFSNWESALGGPNNLQGNIVGRPGVVHLITDDIYLDIVVTSWAGGGVGGAFSYTRSSPVPLPAAAVFLLSGLSGLLLLRRRASATSLPR